MHHRSRSTITINILSGHSIFSCDVSPHGQRSERKKRWLKWYLFVLKEKGVDSYIPILNIWGFLFFDKEPLQTKQETRCEIENVSRWDGEVMFRSHPLFLFSSSENTNLPILEQINFSHLQRKKVTFMSHPPPLLFPSHLISHIWCQEGSSLPVSDLTG